MNDFVYINKIEYFLLMLEKWESGNKDAISFHLLNSNIFAWKDFKTQKHNINY